jgi:excisionase family DNA binding protein
MNFEWRRWFTSVHRDAGVEVTPDYLLCRIKVEEAAEFLRTTPGEIYNLTSRRQIPFSRLGKKGLRFCRLDLIQWQRERSRRPSV